MPEHLQILVNSFVVGLSGAMMPGPLFALVVARTPKEGLSTGTLMAVGHSILELFMVIALSFGLALFVRESPTVSRVIAILGGVGLLYMAYGMFTSLRQHDGPVSKSSFAARDGKSSTSQLIGMGIATTISSPFWFMWWIMVGSALLLSSMKAGYGGPTAKSG